MLEPLAYFLNGEEGPVCSKHNSKWTNILNNCQSWANWIFHCSKKFQKTLLNTAPVLNRWVHSGPAAVESTAMTLSVDAWFRWPHSTSRLSAYIINSKLRNLAHQDPHSLVSLHFLCIWFPLLFFMPTRMNKNDDYHSLPSPHSEFWYSVSPPSLNYTCVHSQSCLPSWKPLL